MKMKVISTKIIIIFAALISVVLISGCRSKQKSVDTNAYSKRWDMKRAIDDVLNNELTFENISAKGSIELIMGESGRKISAHYKIAKDNVMQVSLRLPILGEVMRMDITPDKVTVVDRMKGQYAVEKFADSELLRSVDLNYYNLQALLTNSLFLPGERSIEKKDYSRFGISANGDMLRLQTIGNPDLIYDFGVDASEKITSLLVTKKNLEKVLHFVYSDFVEYENKQLYPTTMLASVRLKKKDVSLAITYSGLEIDKNDFKVDTSVSRKYREITLKELLQTYMKIK